MEATECKSKLKHMVETSYDNTLDMRKQNPYMKQIREENAQQFSTPGVGFSSDAALRFAGFSQDF